MFKKDNNQDVFENAAKILYGDKKERRGRRKTGKEFTFT